MPNPTPLFYVEQRGFEDRLGHELLSALTDDNNDGSPDGGPVRALLLDAVAFVEAFMRAAGYDLVVARATTPPPPDVVRLIYDRAVAMAGRRFPEAVHWDVEERIRSINEELKLLQKKIIRLDLNVNDPKPAGVGGKVGRIGMSPYLEGGALFDDLGDYPGGRRG